MSLNVGDLRLDNIPDTGCDLAPKCLECPFDRCLLEEPGGAQQYRVEEGDRTVLRLKEDGMTAREIAAALGISLRTVRRRLARVRKTTKPVGQVSEPALRQRSG